MVNCAANYVWQKSNLPTTKKKNNYHAKISKDGPGSHTTQWKNTTYIWFFHDCMHEIDSWEICRNLIRYAKHLPRQAPCTTTYIPILRKFWLRFQYFFRFSISWQMFYNTMRLSSKLWFSVLHNMYLLYTSNLLSIYYQVYIRHWNYKRT